MKYKITIPEITITVEIEEEKEIKESRFLMGFCDDKDHPTGSTCTKECVEYYNYRS